MKYQLGDWIVQESANLLTRGDDGVRLEKRVMAVLIQLINANGDVVAKEALIDTVWKGAAVSDHSVANAISDLRRALGDDRRNPQFIETIPKRGYRLIISVKEIPSSSDESTAAPPKPKFFARINLRLAVVSLIALFAILAGLLAARPSTQPRLFLADIENATGDARYDIAGNAATEMLAVSLANGDFRLIRWRASGSDLTQINARKRDRVASGRIILDGDTPILALSIIDPDDGASIWAAAYSLDAGNYGALASMIVNDLTEPLALEPYQLSYAAADPAIVEAYWRARYLWSLREHTAIRQALQILTEITLNAPDYAPAHAALADIYAHKTAEELGIDRTDTFLIAERHLARAAELNPNLSEAFVTRAYLLFFRDHNSALAMENINEAIDAHPNNAIAWQTKAMIASAANGSRLSLKAIEHALALDPLSASIMWDKVWFLYIARRYDDALIAAKEARHIAPPVNIYEALIHLAREDKSAALESWLQRALARGLSHQRSTEIREIARLDGVQTALAALAAIMNADTGYNEHPIPHAILLTALNKTDDAITLLLNETRPETSWWWRWYGVIPGLDDVRRDQRLNILSADETRAAGG